MGKRTFSDWLGEVRMIVRDMLEADLEELPEYDVSDARAYFDDRSSPSCYFRECLSEDMGDDVQRLREIVSPDAGGGDG